MRGGVILQPPIKRWVCPNCDQTHVTREQQPHSAFHSCAGLKGMTAPFIEEGVSAKVEAREREDYVGRERVQTNEDNRPIMSVVTTRDDGTDAVVFAPTARADG